MNLENWIQNRNQEIKIKDVYRGMFGFIRPMYSSKLACYYPECLASAVQKTLPNAIITDIYYSVEREDQQSQTFELIVMKTEIDNQLFDIDLSYENDTNGGAIRLSYLVDEKKETTEEMEEIVRLLYQHMREFLELYSPHRLFLLTSPLQFSVPSWINEKVKQ